MAVKTPVEHLFDAIRRDDMLSVALWIPKVPDIDGVYERISPYLLDTYTPLTYALFYRHYAIAGMLLDLGASATVHNPLSHLTASAKSLEEAEPLLRQLLEHGADINAHGDGFYTRSPLLMALDNDRVHFTDFYLDHGVDVNVGTERGTTPLYYAFLNRNFRHMKRLVELGADPFITPYGGVTLLETALEATYNDSPPKIRAFMVSIASDRKNINHPKNNILHVAVKMRDIKLIRLLRARGINPFRLFDGKTAHCIAREAGDVEIMHMLENFKVKRRKANFY